MAKPITQPSARPMTPRNKHTRSSSRCSPNVIVLFSNRSSFGFLAMRLFGNHVGCEGIAGAIARTMAVQLAGRGVDRSPRAVRNRPAERNSLGTYGGNLPYQSGPAQE